MEGRGLISIWFFIGVILWIYGVIIFGASVYDYLSPSPTQVVMADLHAGIWWGALLIVIGAVYSLRFRPGRVK